MCFVLLSRNQTVKPVRKDQAAETLVSGTWTRIKVKKTEVFWVYCKASFTSLSPTCVQLSIKTLSNLERA